MLRIFDFRTYWKTYLIIIGILVLVISMLYTTFLATKLKEGEEKSVQLYARAIEDLTKASDVTNDISLQLTQDFKIPAILTDNKDNIITAVNFSDELNEDTLFLKDQLKEIKSNGYKPIDIKDEFVNQKVYYKNSRLYTYLTYFPYIQLLLLSVFIGMGYLGISAARKSEQNRLWVGMAKETAHQLGTPISAIIAWIEHLKVMAEDDPDQMEVLSELNNDVQKLERVADRFSKIGSIPVLTQNDVYQLLENTRIYMGKRAPRKVEFVFPQFPNDQLIKISVNAPLFDWVLENLIRNALDAMEGKGVIGAEVYEDPNNVFIDISDTGKGMTSKQAGNIFKPGFTTKARGWGLGLSLSKRIIEEYHGGKIFVKKTSPGKGTTFTIRLPKAVVKH
ncbi:MAG: HAMP domain-containing sensor histidine kinase [Saprospiraceae bacterium]|uniref:sensor histidine kinase n=1 Tax=Candidatus Brachybacter algidus TaxID=2982024 RepID=UPI00258119D3|nr:HAMP domain-containing sensor histidine kinase [Candidatus Brachybacter algidus]